MWGNVGYFLKLNQHLCIFYCAMNILRVLGYSPTSAKLTISYAWLFVSEWARRAAPHAWYSASPAGEACSESVVSRSRPGIVPPRPSPSLLCRTSGTRWWPCSCQSPWARSAPPAWTAPWTRTTRTTLRAWCKVLLCSFHRDWFGESER